MGLFGNLMAKVGEKMEKVMSKNMTGESKEEYEKEKEATSKIMKETSEQIAKYNEELSAHKTTASASDLKNLEVLLQKIEVIDSQKLWIGGFDNFKANQNAKAANLFSGNKNIKVLSLCGETYYLSKYNENSFYAYKKFLKADVAKVEIEGLVSKKIKIAFTDGKNYSVDVSENGDKVKEFKTLLS